MRRNFGFSQDGTTQKGHQGLFPSVPPPCLQSRSSRAVSNLYMVHSIILLRRCLFPRLQASTEACRAEIAAKMSHTTTEDNREQESSAGSAGKQTNEAAGTDVAPITCRALPLRCARSTSCSAALQVDQSNPCGSCTAANDRAFNQCS